MRVDYHTHHWRCQHAEGDLSDYVEAAIAAGLDEIGLSDHSPIYHLGDDPKPLKHTIMSQLELPNYVRAMEEVRDRYADRITVRLSIESDYILGWDRHYRELWQRYPLDYVIGSVHWLGTWTLWSAAPPDGKSVADMYELYLHTLQAAARSGAYEVLGHIDLFTQLWPDHGLEASTLWDETLRVIAEAGLTVELNTSGYRDPARRAPYPVPTLVERLHHYAIPVTLGSDAHKPEEVGSHFDEAVALLMSAGYRQIATYAGRRRIMVPLE